MPRAKTTTKAAAKPAATPRPAQKPALRVPNTRATNPVITKAVNARKGRKK